MAERILVVDDDLDSLKLIGLMLQRNGYEVSAANTGAQALARATAEHPDLIILDVMMPDMNGYEVCRRLRANGETKLIPIIMFTAKTLIDDKVAGFEAGADDYLTKPTHPSELASRVRAILSRNSQRREEVNTGTLIGVLGAKGGLGTSILALNIAAARVLAGDNAIISDLRLGMGTLGLALGAPKSNGMATALAKAIPDIKQRGLEVEMFAHSSGLRALLSSPRASDAQTVYIPEAVTSVVRTLRQMGSPLVLDLGSGYTQMVSHLQNDLDHLIVTIDAHPMTLHLARELLRELETAQLSDRLSVIAVSRAQGTAQPAWSELDRVLGHSIRSVLPPSADLMLQAYQAQVPAVLYQPAAMYSTQVVKIAEDITTHIRQSRRSAVLQ
ncbi:MAG: response regulator [Chloroflexota bacterium]|nr:response regulator [Chloroflexota bacterium]